MLQRVLTNPLLSVNVEHYQAQLVSPSNFTPYYQPDYLATNPGVFASGVEYAPNPNNPIRGTFCQAPRQSYQDKSGIYYVAQYNLFLIGDPGEIYILDDKYPKRQDKFVIQGRTYYAIAPAMPCQQGEIVAAYKIELNLQRYPVEQ